MSKILLALDINSCKLLFILTKDFYKDMEIPYIMIERQSLLKPIN